MSVIDPIAANLQVLGAGIGRALEEMTAADQAAQRIAERAARNGFTGIALALGRVRDSIKELNATIAALNEPVARAQSTLAAVPKQITPGETVTALKRAQVHLDSIHNRIGAALAKIDQAGNLVEAALQEVSRARCWPASTRSGRRCWQ